MPFRAPGGVAEVVVVESGGHLDGVVGIAKQGESARAFLVK